MLRNAMVCFSSCLVLSSAALTGCLPGESASDDDVLDRPDAGEGGADPLEYEGAYRTAGVWDLSGPLGGGRTMGDVVAELLVDKIVDLLGVPSIVREDAHDAVEDAVHDPARDFVNDLLPPELVANSPTLSALSEVMARVAVTTRMDLAASGGDDFEGVEEVLTLSLVGDGEPVAVSFEELLDGSGAVSLAADLDGQQTGADRLSIAPHEFQLRYGRLLIIAGRELLGIDLEALSAQALARLECSALIHDLTGGSGTLEITIAGETVSVGGSLLADACAAARGEVAEFLLGFVRYDTGVLVGGDVVMADSGSDGRADTLASSRSYGGEFTVLPSPIAPRVGVTFTGVRDE